MRRTEPRRSLRDRPRRTRGFNHEGLRDHDGHERRATPAERTGVAHDSGREPRHLLSARGRCLRPHPAASRIAGRRQHAHGIRPRLRPEKCPTMSALAAWRRAFTPQEESVMTRRDWWTGICLVLVVIVLGSLFRPRFFVKRYAQCTPPPCGRSHRRKDFEFRIPRGIDPIDELPRRRGKPNRRLEHEGVRRPRSGRV